MPESLCASPSQGPRCALAITVILSRWRPQLERGRAKAQCSPFLPPSWNSYLTALFYSPKSWQDSPSPPTLPPWTFGAPRSSLRVAAQLPHPLPAPFACAPEIQYQLIRFPVRKRRSCLCRDCARWVILQTGGIINIKFLIFISNYYSCFLWEQKKRWGIAI